MTRGRSASSQPIGRSRGLAAAAVTAAAVLAAGCAAESGFELSADAIGHAELLRAEPLVGAAELPPVPDADVLGLDQDMRQFVADHVDMNSSGSRRLRQLLDAIIGEDRLDIVYKEHTYTASEAFRLREANCLSYTNMLIALGRQAGLSVRYQEVDVPPDWSRRGDMLVLSRHLDALVTYGDENDEVVDFNMADFRTTYDRRVVSDTRALAHYYGNLAVDRMLANETVEAVRYFRKALTQDPGFTAAWVNLGSLYLRAGQPEWARSAWQYALSLDPGELVAMSNLERLDRDNGRIASADKLRQRIGRHRMHNPYYRYYLAQREFDHEDYDAAIGHLKFAVGRKKNEDRFFALLGLSYLRKGDTESAQRWLARAEAVAEDGDLQRNYHGKLEILKRSGAG